ncbi:Aspartic peptidase domain containing protein [Naviculisporaceae sp. PSN 640]
MKLSLAVTAGSVAARAVAGASAANGVVQWDIQKIPHPPHAKPKFRNRASTYEEAVANLATRGGYFASCKFGTPGQEMTLQLDTGSSDIWVPKNTATQCRRKSGCPFGSFNPSQSSTYTVVAPGIFSIGYLDGTTAKGDYFTDVFEIGGATVQNMTMGLGIKTDIGYGLVGVGYKLNEAIVGDTRSTLAAYPNLPITMVDEGLINTVAYSIWLNDLDASAGSILFGGIDTKKYHGELARMLIYPDESGLYTEFTVALTSLHASSPSGTDTLTSDSFPISVLLDTGTTLAYLPTDIATQVWEEVGAIYLNEFRSAVVPCSLASSKGYFTFGFAGPNGPRLNVSMDELVLDLTTGNPLVFENGPYEGQDACQFGIQNSTGGQYILGDTFLRSVYVVYDLDNNQIGIAQTNFNSTGSNIVPFPSRSAEIPSATAVPDEALATIKPAVTSPAYAASAGFTDSASSPSHKNAAAGLPDAFEGAQLLVLGLSTTLMMLGSGVFFVL